ncbi:unnamed protein product [Rotaria sp. Silwood2]|nr:unnamed protein product [Rotaria sp. Silwood2]CAF4444044.1 unnamed protein product [Rotaria sp. Silwood2]
MSICPSIQNGSNWQSINLKSFQRDVDGNVLENLSKQCGIKYINTSSCHHIDDQGIKLITSSCSYLECWDISWCMNMNITENDIRILAESCSKFTIFKAEGCTHMTNNAAIELGKNYSNLLVLVLNRRSSLTDDNLIALAHYSPLLDTLIVANCTGLTDDTLIILEKYCYQLNKLHGIVSSEFSTLNFYQWLKSEEYAL